MGLDTDPEVWYHRDGISHILFHWTKTKDIINRGGGKLIVQLCNTSEEEALAEPDVTVRTDGIARTVSVKLPLRWIR